MLVNTKTLLGRTLKVTNSGMHIDDTLKPIDFFLSCVRSSRSCYNSTKFEVCNVSRDWNRNANDLVVALRTAKQFGTTSRIKIIEMPWNPKRNQKQRMIKTLKNKDERGREKFGVTNTPEILTTAMFCGFYLYFTKTIGMGQCFWRRWECITTIRFRTLRIRLEVWQEHSMEDREFINGTSRIRAIYVVPPSPVGAPISLW